MTPRSNSRRPQQPPPTALFFTRKEAAGALRISVGKLDQIIGQGKLKAKKHGHSTFVMRSEIERYVEQWPDARPRRR